MDFILVTGDKANFLPNFGAAVVAVRPGELNGTGGATFDGNELCIEGDEAQVSVPGCMYATPQYSIPGAGTLKIDSLASDQVATKTHSASTAVLLKGSTFKAKFEVQSPAQQPTAGGPVPDSTAQYSGSGSFITINGMFRGT